MLRIDHPLPEPYEVNDYDFTFDNGIVMSFTIAKSLGDTIDFEASPLAVRITFTEKPSLTNPDVKNQAEDITIFMAHVISVAHRARHITPPSHEEMDQYAQILHPGPRTLQ